MLLLASSQLIDLIMKRYRFIRKVDGGISIFPNTLLPEARRQTSNGGGCGHKA
jgi:hypothetical protein